jgi:2-C-methyl-D-erythritol 4-phosphate cytidylyltransferase
MADSGQSSKKSEIAAVIPAAGSGLRMGGNLSKQFMDLGGKPILAVTLETFQSCPAVKKIFLVVPSKDVAFCRSEIVETYGFDKVEKIVPGGPTRQQSVHHGIKATGGKYDFILIHDGVRPFATRKLVEKAIETALEHGASISALPAKETIKKVNEYGEVIMTHDRKTMWLVQTPQVFRYTDIMKAHKKAVEENNLNSTDDSLLIEGLGIRVRVIEGLEDNIKITSPHDLELARFILSRRT